MKKIVIFDLDQTLVDTSRLTELRKSQRWDSVIANLNQASLYPKIPELLQMCRENNLMIAIVTSSPKHVAEAVCHHFNIEYDFLLGFRCASFPKPSYAPIMALLKQADVKPWEAISIGDRCVDIAASKAAGIKDPIGALWGADERNELLLSFPHWICETVEAAKALVSAICKGDTTHLDSEKKRCSVEFNKIAWPTGKSDPATRPYISQEEYNYLRLRKKGPWFFSYANQLVADIKLHNSDLAENEKKTKYKDRACDQFAHELDVLLPEGAAIAFIPTSKKPDHPEYNDRWEKIGKTLKSQRPDVTIHHPLEAIESTAAVHTTDSSSDARHPNAVRRNLRWLGFSGEPPALLYLIDDVLTTGGHFAACKAEIQAHCSTKVEGIFWTAHITSDLEWDEQGFEGI